MKSELTLQCAIDRAQDSFETVRRSPPLLSRLIDGPPTRHFTERFFDTPDLSLHGLSAALSLRQRDEGCVQILRFNGDEQIFTPCSNAAPDCAALRASLSDESPMTDSLKALLDANAAFEPVFTLETTRTSLTLAFPDGSPVDCRFDEVRAHSAQTQSAFATLTLSSAASQSDALAAFALELLDVAPLTLAHQSAEARGFALLIDRHEAAVRAAPLKLKRRDTIKQAFARIVRNCIAQVEANAHGVMSGHDPSSVHQMRVGLRRLRSALDLFDPLIPTPDPLREELVWIANELGSARDWEVLAGSTLPRVFGNAPDDTHASDVTDAAQAIARENRAHAALAVDSTRYARLILHLRVMTGAALWRDPSLNDDRASDAAVLDFAKHTLADRHATLLKRGRGLASLEPAPRHRARIAAKKLRYATEFFSSLFPEPVIEHYVNSLSRLQDDLGWLNDIAIADTLLKTLARDQPHRLGAASYARGYLASHVAVEHDRLRKRWKQFQRLSAPQ